MKRIAIDRAPPGRYGYPDTLYLDFGNGRILSILLVNQQPICVEPVHFVKNILPICQEVYEQVEEL